MCDSFVWNLKNITYLVVCERAICVPMLGCVAVEVTFESLLPSYGSWGSNPGLQAWRLVTLLSEPSARSPVHNLFLAFPFPISFIGTPRLEAVSVLLFRPLSTLSSHLAVSHAGQACSGASVFGLGFLSFHSWEALHGSLLDSLAPLLRTVFSSASPGTPCPLPLLCFSFVAPLSLTYNYRPIAGPPTPCSSSVVVLPGGAIQSLGNALGISESSLNKNPDSR